jgi:uncharacterized protein DUF6582
MSTLTQDQRKNLPDKAFAFPDEQKEPIHDAEHVRNAVARFNQLRGVTDSERDAAWKRILSAAKKFHVEVEESDWRDLPHGGRPRPR